jgi:hypothetical protein
MREGDTMIRNVFGPSSTPLLAEPDPLLLFIRQAQIAIYYLNPPERREPRNVSGQQGIH